MSYPRLGALLAGFCFTFFTIPAMADSHARIVRLSYVEGDVQMDRNVGQGYEKAIINVPITEGTKLRTRLDGLAEVEFEDGSTLRITPDSQIEFSQLSLKDSGSRVSLVSVKHGTAYVNFAGTSGEDFSLTFASQSVPLTQAARLRLDVGKTSARLAVFSGAVQAEGPAGKVDVAKKQSVTFDLTDPNDFTLAKNVKGEPYDSWDKQQDQYHDRYLKAQSYNPSPYGYGVSDLNYYGSFIMAPGIGSCWQPYFMSTAWDPFMNGAWLWSGAGYSWVSSYPWGWLPYTYGSWNYFSGGWCWNPGSNWMGYNGFPVVVNPPVGFHPPKPPIKPAHTIVAVNRGPSAVLARSSGDLVIARGSAGLGIPRGSVSNLNRLSVRVQEKGFVSQSPRMEFSSPAFSGANHGVAAHSGPAGEAYHSASVGMSNASSAGSMHSSGSSAAAGAHK